MTELTVTPFSGPLAGQLGAAPQDGVRLYWLGQAGFVIEAAGRRILIDPYLSDSLAEKYQGRPFPHRRMMAAPMTAEEAGPVDLVLTTHQHTDHMDPATLRPIAALNPDCRFVAPRAALEEASRRIGAGAERIIAVDAGERISPLPGIAITAVRAAHESLERTPEGWHRFLGYVIEAGGVRVYHSGDTVFFDGLAEEVAGLRPDLALLPVNGRSRELAEAGIAGNLTLDEACELAGRIGAQDMIAHHYGMFDFNTADPAAIDAKAAAGNCAPRIHRAGTAVEYRLSKRSGGSSVPPRPRLSNAGNGNDNILEVARMKRDELRKSDRKVCELVLADPKRMLNATVAQAAKWAGVSQPTVIRFCTSIGCHGYQDFKLRLAQSLALGTPATHSVILDVDTPAEVAEKIFDYTITSLDWVRSRLDADAIARAVAILEKANRIEFFGFGASGIVARDAQQKFPLFGVPCGAETDAHQQIMLVSMLKPGDVVVVISNTGATLSIIETARRAREQGCAVIGLVGTNGPLVEFCDVVLMAETLENTNIYTPTISRIAALTVVDILSTAVALRRGKEHIERFSGMKRNLRYLRADTDKP